MASRRVRVRVLPETERRSGLCEAVHRSPPLKGGPRAKNKGVERQKTHPSMAAPYSFEGEGRQRSIADKRAQSAQLDLLAGPLAFRRSATALAGTSERSSSAQAALHASGRTQALPAPPIALKPSTWRSGHSAGGALQFWVWQFAFAQTASTANCVQCLMPGPPGSGLRDRPREPHSLHFQDRI